MKEWIMEQVKSMLVLLGVCTALGALEWITFAAFGLN